MTMQSSASAKSLRILYLVHSLDDPAVRRRVMMLEEGGASVTVAGFRRGPTSPNKIAGAPTIDLGQTHDGKFVQRLMSLAFAAIGASQSLGRTQKPDVIIARNLEMLALGARAKRVLGDATIPLVYECLDVHRLMLRSDMIGSAMRSAERRLGRGVSLLVTSSPAFNEHYFDRYHQIDAPNALVENKFFEPDRRTGQPASDAAAQPWKIGWFGALRCQRSFALLSAFTRKAEGRFEVVLRGRPSEREFPSFSAMVAREPFMSFGGAYRNPEDMQALYDGVHFAWAIDFFEEGQNSSWLLPNRLYEGCRFGSVPIAVSGTETARFLARQNIGLVLDNPRGEGLSPLLEGMTEARYAGLRGAVLERDPRLWSCDRHDCLALVDQLRTLTGQPALASALIEEPA